MLNRIQYNTLNYGVAQPLLYDISLEFDTLRVVVSDNSPPDLVSKGYWNGNLFGVIQDPEEHELRYRVFINGELRQDWTSFEIGPVSFYLSIDDTMLSDTEPNFSLFQVEDIQGATQDIAYQIPHMPKLTGNQHVPFDAVYTEKAVQLLSVIHMAPITYLSPNDLQMAYRVLLTPNERKLSTKEKIRIIKGKFTRWNTGINNKILF